MAQDESDLEPLHEAVREGMPTPMAALAQLGDAVVRPASSYSSLNEDPTSASLVQHEPVRESVAQNATAVGSGLTRRCAAVARGCRA